MPRDPWFEHWQHSFAFLKLLCLPPFCLEWLVTPRNCLTVGPDPLSKHAEPFPRWLSQNGISFTRTAECEKKKEAYAPRKSRVAPNLLTWFPGHAHEHNMARSDIGWSASSMSDKGRLSKGPLPTLFSSYPDHCGRWWLPSWSGIQCQSSRAAAAVGLCIHTAVVWSLEAGQS